MSLGDETLEAAVSVLRGLARGAPQSQASSPYNIHSSVAFSNGLELPKFHLPGKNSSTKQAFESEISALARRIQYLESKADSVNQTLPDTPNEFSLPTSPFNQNGELKGPSVSISNQGTGRSPGRQASISNRSVRLSNLLAARESRNGDHDTSRTVSEDDIAYLRDHVQRQAEEIKTQKIVIAGVSEELHAQEEETKRTLVKVEREDVFVLERELRKHQQANEAFQKALREIGGIITQVANGDLSMRVQVHVSEMDPEIATFKRTINTMMDQLQVFGSEVSRVAREVGTEGILGGQAQITGVHGVWKELTENGMSPMSPLRLLALDLLTCLQSTSWQQILRTKCEKSRLSQPLSHTETSARRFNVEQRARSWSSNRLSTLWSINYVRSLPKLLAWPVMWGLRECLEAKHRSRVCKACGAN